MNPSAALHLRLLVLTGLFAAGVASAQVPSSPGGAVGPCPPLPSLKMPPSFSPGEVLEFDLDAVGAKAGTMTMRVLPAQGGLLPIEAQVQTNTFFSKVRRVHGSGTSYLRPRTLRPSRYLEDATENELHRSAEVGFAEGKDHLVSIAYTINGSPGRRTYRPPQDALDNVGAIALLRQLPFAEGLPVCMDVYGIRRLWRLSGKVVSREHITLALGEFDAWHLSGEATRLDDPSQRREIHLWISDDERRLPLVAVGSIDLGAVRATLTSFTRPREKKLQVSRKSDLKW